MNLVTAFKKQGYVKKIPADVRLLYAKTVEKYPDLCMAQQRRNIKAFLNNPVDYLNNNVISDAQFFEFLCLVRQLKQSQLAQVVRKIREKYPFTKEGLGRLYLAAYVYARLPFIEVFKFPFRVKINYFSSPFELTLAEFNYINEFADKPYTIEEFLSRFTDISEDIKNDLRLDAFYELARGNFEFAKLGNFDSLVDYINFLYEKKIPVNEKLELLLRFGGFDKFVRNFLCSDADSLDKRFILDLATLIAEEYNLDFNPKRPPMSFFLKLREQKGRDLYDCLLDVLSQFQDTDFDVKSDPWEVFDYVIDKYNPNQFVELAKKNDGFKKLVDSLSDKDTVYNLVMEFLRASPPIPAIQFVLFVSKIAPDTIDVDLLSRLLDEIDRYTFDEWFSDENADKVSFYDFYKLIANSKVSEKDKAALIARLLETLQDMGSLDDFSYFSGISMKDLFAEISKDIPKNQYLLYELGKFSKKVDLTEPDGILWIEAFRTAENYLKFDDIPYKENIEEGNIYVAFSNLPPLIACQSYDFFAKGIRELNDSVDLVQSIENFPVSVPDDVKERAIKRTKELYEKIKAKKQTIPEYLDSLSTYFPGPAVDIQDWKDTLTDELDKEIENNPRIIDDDISSITYGSKPVILEHEHINTLLAKVVTIEILEDILRKTVEGRKCSNVLEEIVEIKKEGLDLKLKVSHVAEEPIITAQTVFKAAIPAFKKAFTVDPDFWTTLVNSTGYLTVTPKNPYRIGKQLIQYLLTYLFHRVDESFIDGYVVEKPYKKMTETERWVAEVLKSEYGMENSTLEAPTINKFIKVLKSSYTNELNKLTKPIDFVKDYEVLVTSNPYNVANMSASSYISSCQRIITEGQFSCLPDRLGFPALKAAFRRSFDYIFMVMFGDQAVARLSGSIEFDKPPLIYFGEKGNIYGEVSTFAVNNMPLCPTEKCTEKDINGKASKVIEIARAILKCIMQNVRDTGFSVGEKPVTSYLYG